MRRVLSLSLLCVLGIAHRGWAQQSDDDWARCADRNPDVAIVGCSAVIRGSARGPADLATAYRNRAAAQSRRGDRRGAIADYSAAIELEPDAPALYVSRGLAERALGDLESAIRDYTHAIALNPSAAPPYVSRGFAEADQGALDAAIDDYNRALDRDPRYAFAYADRGVARAGKGDLDGAAADFAAAAAINPSYAFAYTNLGNLKRARGDSPGAAAEYARALRADARFALAYFNRGVLEFNDRDLDAALMDLRQAIAIDGSTDVADQARLYEWIIRARRGERDAATRDLLVRVSQRATGYVDPWSARRMEFLAGAIDGNALLLEAKAPRALLPAAIARRSAQALFLIGMARTLAGDIENARTFLGDCMAIDHTPDSPYSSAAAELSAGTR
ncbi:MAG TPA: tetratricopeptide repeat protein [Vicinamibacterales bacterium]|nr:tetratricopeptide repeat protein [Vicinamibacterales bacterium]